ncbi:hypothetical protein J6590_058848 [Homalodisca vitripennis]|nr:hypothetical protein J6590_058848 [Homalodisca vitripennis]
MEKCLRVYLLSKIVTLSAHGHVATVRYKFDIDGDEEETSPRVAIMVTNNLNIPLTVVVTTNPRQFREPTGAELCDVRVNDLKVISEYHQRLAGKCLVKTESLSSHSFKQQLRSTLFDSVDYDKRCTHLPVVFASL